MSSPYSLFGEFIDKLKKLREEMPYLSHSLERLLNAAQRGKLIVRVPREVTANLEREQVADLNYFWCPRCGRLYRRPRDDNCERCGGRLVQAYIGAPYLDTPSGRPHVLSDIARSRGGAYEYIFIPIDKCPNIKRCYLGRRKLKRVVRLNPDRPLASLAYACPYEDEDAKRCTYRQDVSIRGSNVPLCTYSNGDIKYLRMPSRQNQFIKLTPPSEALTKSFSITLYKVFNEREVEFDSELMTGVKEVSFVNVKIYQISLMFLAGSPYARRSARMPVLVASGEGRYEVLGRRLDSEGLLVRLKVESVKRAMKELEEAGFPSRSRSDITICHSVAHLFLITAPLITGLSEVEFSEAIRTDLERGICEFLIYDNSPGGIGGVRSLISEDDELKDDYLSLLSKRLECPRACLIACKACLFSANCIWLNYSLNRHTLPYIINLEEAYGYRVE